MRGFSRHTSTVSPTPFPVPPTVLPTPPVAPLATPLTSPFPSAPVVSPTVLPSPLVTPLAVLPTFPTRGTQCQHCNSSPSLAETGMGGGVGNGLYLSYPQEPCQQVLRLYLRHSFRHLHKTHKQISTPHPLHAVVVIEQAYRQRYSPPPPQPH